MADGESHSLRNGLLAVAGAFALLALTLFGLTQLGPGKRLASLPAYDRDQALFETVSKADFKPLADELRSEYPELYAEVRGRFIAESRRGSTARKAMAWALRPVYDYRDANLEKVRHASNDTLIAWWQTQIQFMRIAKARGPEACADYLDTGFMRADAAASLQSMTNLALLFHGMREGETTPVRRRDLDAAGWGRYRAAIIALGQRPDVVDGIAEGRDNTFKPAVRCDFALASAEAMNRLPPDLAARVVLDRMEFHPARPPEDGSPLGPPQPQTP